MYIGWYIPRVYIEWYIPGVHRVYIPGWCTGRRIYPGGVQGGVYTPGRHGREAYIHQGGMVGRHIPQGGVPQGVPQGVYLRVVYLRVYLRVCTLGEREASAQRGAGLPARKAGFEAGFLPVLSKKPATESTSVQGRE